MGKVRVRFLTAAKNLNSEEQRCELGMCVCSGASLYLLRVVHARAARGCYMKHNKCGLGGLF